MPGLIERMKKAFYHRDVIVHYDGEYWWAHDSLKEHDCVIGKNSDFHVLVEMVDEYFVKEAHKKDKKMLQSPLNQGN